MIIKRVYTVIIMFPGHEICRVTISTAHMIVKKYFYNLLLVYFFKCQLVIVG